MTVNETMYAKRLERLVSIKLIYYDYIYDWLQIIDFEFPGDGFGWDFYSDEGMVEISTLIIAMIPSLYF